MNVQMTRHWGGLKAHLNDPLYMNSIFILASRVLSVTTGFVFWILAAHLYSVEDVGLGVGMVSAIGITTLLATAGLEYSVIRFSASYDMGRILNSSFAIIAVVSLVVGIGYCLVTLVLAPRSMTGNVLVYSLFLVALSVISSAGLFAGNAFLAMKKPREFMIMNFFVSSRVLFLVPLVFLGSSGIFGAVLAAYAIGLLFVFYTVGRSIKFDLKIDRDYLLQSFRFSSGNYVANILYQLPFMIMPVLVLQMLGPAQSAILYIALCFGCFLEEVPAALGTSLFVVGSHGTDLRRSVIKTGLAVYALIVPCILMLFLFGGQLLMLYRSEYLQGFDLLKLMAFSCLFHAVYYMFISIKKVQMKMGSILKINALWFVIFLSLSYVLIGRTGINGVGYAQIVAYVILDLYVIVMAKKEHWI